MGSVREREHLMDKLAIAELRRRIWATRASPGRRGHSPRGPMGQGTVASGIRLSMRIWERESPDTESKAETEANYETVGSVIAGRAKTYRRPGRGPGTGRLWIVPKDSRHSYKIVEAFAALKAATRCEMHGRDQSSQPLNTPFLACALASQKSTGLTGHFLIFHILLIEAGEENKGCCSAIIRNGLSDRFRINWGRQSVHVVVCLSIQQL